MPDAIRPGVGRKVATEQKDAGTRRLHPPSEPAASQTSPVATLTAAPPEEPPQVRPVSHGLRVGPKMGLVVFAPMPSSGTFDFAIGMAPLRSSVSTPKSERSGTWSVKIGEPQVVRTPASRLRSLMAMGKPARGMSDAKASWFISRLACCRARSKHRIGSALTAGSTCSIRRIEASTRSSGDTVFCRSNATAWRAVSLVSSSMATPEHARRTSYGL